MVITYGDVCSGISCPMWALSKLGIEVEYKFACDNDKTCKRYILEKWKPEQAITCIYFDGEKGIYFIKRFLLENTVNVQQFMPSEHPKSFIEFVIIIF